MSEAEAETKYKQENTARGEIWEILENQQYLNGFMPQSSFQNESVNSILHFSLTAVSTNLYFPQITWIK